MRSLFSFNACVELLLGNKLIGNSLNNSNFEVIFLPLSQQ
jgi:hypothetical protein